MPSFVSVTPMIPAGPSLDACLEFYTKWLGFEVAYRAGGAAGIRRDGVAFNVVQSDDRHWIENCSVSIGVRDLDGLYASMAGAPVQVGPLEMKFWGRREFHMIDPVGVCLQFYEAPQVG